MTNLVAAMRPSLRTVRNALFVAMLLLLAVSVYGAGRTIAAKEAANHVGKHGTVCGTVASARFASRSRGQPTFLNLDRPYPNHIFTIVIWGSDRLKFNDAPETHYQQKAVCVTGTINAYRGRPQIIAKNPDQIRLQ